MSTQKLLSLASPAIGSELGIALDQIPQVSGPIDRELFRLLAKRNGFFAFEGALHVLPWPSASVGTPMDLQAWNAPELWRGRFEGLVDKLFCFAEDAFGGQFALRESEVVAFDPESGEIVVIADSIEGWAMKVVSDYESMTGFPVAHAWQETNGPIPRGKRLLPKIPFILGGAYDQSNLFAVDSSKGMRYRADLWRQLRDLPDGAKVRLMPLPLH